LHLGGVETNNIMEENNIQAWFNGMSAKRQKERSETQMTLGKLIDKLKTMDPDAMIDGIETPHSYRGYYDDLAFEQGTEKMSVSSALIIATNCMGEVFEGYKGGDFQMGRNTPIWMSGYGTTGSKILGLNDDGTWELGERD
jgi:hypothetical protein